MRRVFLTMASHAKVKNPLRSAPLVLLRWTFAILVRAPLCPWLCGPRGGVVLGVAFNRFGAGMCALERYENCAGPFSVSFKFSFCVFRLGSGTDLSVFSALVW